MLKKLISKFRDSDLYFFLFERNRGHYRIEGSCLKTGNCCRSLILVDRGKPIRSLAEFEKLCARESWNKMFVPHEHIPSDGMLRFSCKNLGADNLCTIHDSRPEICRRYPDLGFLRHGGELLPGCGYRIVPKKSFSEFLDENIK